MQAPLTIFKASAGSGKTYMLVKEYVKIALRTGDPSYFKNILAITFTNKAAGEMKTRVFEFLEELRQDDNESDLRRSISSELGIQERTIVQRANEALRVMMYNYSDIAICTIDSFVLNLVRGFSKELGLPYQFELEMDEEKIVELAIDRMIEDSQNDDYLLRMLNELVVHRINEESPWSFTNELKFFSNQILKDKSRLYLEKLSSYSNSDLIKAKDEILKKKSHFKKETLSKAKAIKKFINDLGIELTDFKKGKAGNFYRIQKILSWDDLSKIKLDFDEYTLIQSDQWFTKGNELEHTLDPHKERIRAKIIELLDSAKAYCTWHIKGNAIYPMLLISNISRAIESIKSEEETLLISDNHKIIHQVIRENPVPFIYERIGERYKHFMIDEFQDTSVTQFHNLIPLLENSLSQGYDNVIVGDPKQSIYRFREGEAEQLQKLPNELHRKEELIEGEYIESLISREGREQNLIANFRSKREIVDFNNSFFSSIKEGLIREYQQVNEFAGYEQEVKKDGQGFVQIKLLDKSDFDTASLTEMTTAINECLEDGFLLKDIAILVKDRNQGEKIANHLAKYRDLPFISQDSLKFHSNSELEFIINVLRQHVYKDQLTSGMRILTFLYGNEIEISFHELAEECCYKDSVDAYAKNRFNIQKCLKRLGYSYLFSSQDEFSLIQTTHAIIKSFSLNINNAFMHQFIDEAHNFSSLNGNNISSFIEFWDQKLSKKSVELPASKNALKILSIHKSKGLQFPVVIIPFTNWRQGGHANYIWADESIDGILPFYLVKDSSFLEKTGFSQVHRTEKEKKLIDNLNLIYVAFTRPENRLYIHAEELSTLNELNSNPYKWINYFVQQTGELGYGNRESIASKSGQQSDSFKFNIPRSDWKDKLVANTSFYHDYVKYEEIKNKKLDGILIHKIFELSNDLEDSIKTIDEMTKKMILNETQATVLKEQFIKMYNHPKIKKILLQEGMIQNELNVVDSSGKSHRPDRVIAGQNSTDIIDLKTGVYNEKHKEQLDQYQSLLEEIGYQSIEKHLIYFNTLETVSWN